MLDLIDSFINPKVSVNYVIYIRGKHKYYLFKITRSLLCNRAGFFSLKSCISDRVAIITSRKFIKKHKLWIILYSGMGI